MNRLQHAPKELPGAPVAVSAPGAASIPIQFRLQEASIASERSYLIVAKASIGSKVLNEMGLDLTDNYF